MILVSVPANSVIPNIANIYFDYNSPVVTNAANTIISLGIIPVSLFTFTAKQDAHGNAVLQWKTVGELNTLYFEILRSEDGINYSTVGRENAHGQGSNLYGYQLKMLSSLEYFRIKMVDRDGRFIYSAVQKLQRSVEAESLAILNNPVRGFLTIETYDEKLINSSAVIINNTGAEVYRFQVKAGVQQIDLTRFAMGIYYLQTVKGAKRFILHHSN